MPFKVLDKLGADVITSNQRLLPLLVGRYTRRFGIPETRQHVCLDSLRLYEG